MLIRSSLLLLAFVLLNAKGACAGPIAYVPNEKLGSVSVVDTGTDTVVGQFSAGKRPRGIVASPDGIACA